MFDQSELTQEALFVLADIYKIEYDPAQIVHCPMLEDELRTKLAEAMKGENA